MQDAQDALGHKMKKIVLATQNPNKVKEMRTVLKDLDIKIVNPPKDFDPIEDGETFFDNSLIKAKTAAKLMNLPALADDSGLQIDSLGGEPGVMSARWAENNEKRIEKALKSLEGITEREAQFVCAMTLVSPEGKLLHSTEGICRGEILHKQKGTNGFGYDPIFWIPPLKKTMAELTLDEKNQISHRSIALRAMMEYLQNN